nr:hypothetical protein CFP56_21795 [Quercus suber]
MRIPTEPHRRSNSCVLASANLQEQSRFHCKALSIALPGNPNGRQIMTTLGRAQRHLFNMGPANHGGLAESLIIKPARMVANVVGPSVQLALKQDIMGLSAVNHRGSQRKLEYG